MEIKILFKSGQEKKVELDGTIKEITTEICEYMTKDNILRCGNGVIRFSEVAFMEVIQ